MFILLITKEIDKNAIIRNDKRIILKDLKLDFRFKICFVENKDNFNEDEWRSLYKLSENTFVEETDSLKKGAAGAGLTDND